MIPTDAAGATQRPLRLLVVDDHADTALMMSRILTSFGHTVRVAHTIADAQAHIDREHFDLLLSDLNLPDGSGHELMNYARAQRAMRGIALTGYCADNEHAAGRESGFSAHLVKPVDIVQLDATIRRVLQGPPA